MSKPSIRIVEFPYTDSERLFAYVADQHWSVWLDSGFLDQQQSISHYARFDIMACCPAKTLVTEGQTTFIKHRQTINDSGAVFDDASTKKLSDDPIDLLKSSLPELPIDKGLPNYVTGALGYFSYDLARRFEVLPSVAADDEELPWMAIGIYDVIVLIDHEQKRTQLVSYGDAAETDKVLEKWRSFIRLTLKHTDEFTEGGIEPDHMIEGNMTRAEYDHKFQRVQDYIFEGDCYQVNLAKRFSLETKQSPWLLYQMLRKKSPAPFGAYLNLPFAAVLSNSPESFIRCDDREVVTNPIKGTKARDHTSPERDQAVAKALYNSAKDRAENLMIVDLMRNDLSRCCELGSVKVPELFEVHSFANVHHLISKITGQLKPSYHALDLLRHCFPGGSITGAPKIRAMQIIEELEPNRRGLYCGAIGYIGMQGNMETNIAIRTIVVKDGIARFSAGGGLVIDSQVDEEYQELVDKASMMTALFTKNTENT